MIFIIVILLSTTAWATADLSQLHSHLLALQPVMQPARRDEKNFIQNIDQALAAMQKVSNPFDANTWYVKTMQPIIEAYKKAPTQEFHDALHALYKAMMQPPYEKIFNRYSPSGAESHFRREKLDKSWEQIEEDRKAQETERKKREAEQAERERKAQAAAERRRGLSDTAAELVQRIEALVAEYNKEHDQGEQVNMWYGLKPLLTDENMEKIKSYRDGLQNVQDAQKTYERLVKLVQDMARIRGRHSTQR